MKPNLEEIEQHLTSMLGVPVTVRDDSHLHHSHRSFQALKAYLTIKLPKLPIQRLALHRKVMSLAMEVCNQPIHAIQIKTT